MSSSSVSREPQIPLPLLWAVVYTRTVCCVGSPPASASRAPKRCIALRGCCSCCHASTLCLSRTSRPAASCLQGACRPDRPRYATSRTQGALRRHDVRRCICRCPTSRTASVAFPTAARRIRRTSRRNRSKSPQTWPDLVEALPFLEDVGQDSVEFAPTSAKSGRKRSQIETTLADIGRSRAKPCQS